MILPGAFDFRMKSFFVDLSGRKTYAEKEGEREGDWKIPLSFEKFFRRRGGLETDCSVLVRLRDYLILMVPEIGIVCQMHIVCDVTQIAVEALLDAGGFSF